MILREIPRLPPPPLNLFSSTTLAPSPCRSRILDVALVSAPLICISWRGPATEVLYEQINLQTMEQCEMLYRTLQSNPTFGSWVKVLHLPRSRGKAQMDLPESQPASTSTTTNVQLLQLSADIFKACDLVQEIDIMTEVSISYYFQADVILIQVMAMCLRRRLVFSRTHPSTHTYDPFVSPTSIPYSAAQDQPTCLLCEN